MMRTSRRHLMLAAGTLPWLAVAAQPGLAPGASAASDSARDAPAPAPALDHRHAPLPLPFRPGALTGLSERMVQSHWENNYGGAVKALNLVRGRLRAALQDPDLPPYVYDGLKREQLLRTGSVVLHERYFANLGGDGRPAGDTRARLAASFGNYDTWETEFRRIALGLGGGSGWVVLGWNPQLQLLENYWMADHASAPAGAVPVLVMDMYEHSYQMDYGAAAAKYVDAYFANVNWDVVAQRLPRAGGPS
jgi:superoxide dismutase, Fe-Mn family